MIHGIMRFTDNTRISQDYPTMDDFLAAVEKERETHELKSINADTVRPAQIRQGRDWA